jgi:hypothetical protein
MANHRPDTRTRRDTGAYTPEKTRAGAIVLSGRLRLTRARRPEVHAPLPHPAAGTVQ